MSQLVVANTLPMTSNHQLEIYRQHRTAQEKYCYFLLAAAGAAIAFAVTQTQGASMERQQFPLAAAVMFWALSFYFGCRHVTEVVSALYSNSTLLQVQAGQDQLVGADPIRIAFASKALREMLERNLKWANRFGEWQFKCLILGAISYLSWHILEMWIRTTPVG